MSKRGRSGATGIKMRVTLALPVGARINCADNTGAKILYIMAVTRFGARLNRLPAASIGDMVLVTVKKGKPELRKKVMPAVVIRQRKSWRRSDGVFICCEDNAGVIVNPKGEMKGSGVSGPVTKECADLWPRVAAHAGAISYSRKTKLCVFCCKYKTFVKMGGCLNTISCCEKCIFTQENFTKQSMSSISENMPDPIAVQESLEDVRAKFISGYEIIEINEVNKFKRPMIRRAMTFMPDCESLSQRTSPLIDRKEKYVGSGLKRLNSGIRLSFLGKVKDKIRKERLEFRINEGFRDDNLSEESTGFMPVISRAETPERWKEEPNYLYRPKGDFEPVVFT
ncbi:hypothetical protein SteCoe_641 [Stentor coeruleus]|uniref:60S ribosomal protein L23 n=1 Tax=Stentor coeruleus TaxID=5963 RepID=A0A1R2D3U1_9CILI|nr:hypothetical protein SteCoe_641 [Stentor coeruleus]